MKRMGAEQHGNWRVTAAAALDWWIDAGVDTLVADEPRDWFGRVGAPAPTLPTPAADDRVDPDFPRDLTAFLAWRVGPSAPEAAWPGPRFAPHGPVDAPLVVFTDHPDADDRDGEILTGAAGRLFDAMLRAIGRSRQNTLVVPLCWTRPLGDHLSVEQVDRLGRLAQHHLALLPAKHALLLGQSVSRAFVGADAPARWGRLRTLNPNDRIVSAIGVPHPRLLLQRRHFKAETWHDLQLLAGGFE